MRVGASRPEETARPAEVIPAFAAAGPEARAPVCRLGAAALGSPIVKLSESIVGGRSSIRSAQSDSGVLTIGLRAARLPSTTSAKVKALPPQSFVFADADSAASAHRKARHSNGRAMGPLDSDPGQYSRDRARAAPPTGS
jgi:hypothetical protein